MWPSAPAGRHGLGSAWIGLVFAAATAVRAAFALNFPTIHGGDASGRLAHADTLILGYQLPLPQLFVMGGKLIAVDPIITRLLFCIWGGVLAAGAAALLGRSFDSRAGLFGAILLCSDPLLTHYSIVPYQEPVAYGLLTWAFYFLRAGYDRGAAGLMALACLSRYEAWLFLPVFLWFCRSRLGGMLACLPVLGWLAWWQGLGPRGLYVIDIDPHSDRWSRVAFLARKLAEYEAPVLLAVAAAALLVGAVRREKFAGKTVALFTAIMGIVVAFGHEYPPGTGLMSERLIHLPVLLALGLAATGLARLSERSWTVFAACLTLALLLAGRNLRFEDSLLRAAAREPDLALARDVARLLEVDRRGDECVTVVAPAIDPSLLRAYIVKVGASFGDTSRARELASSLEGASPDRDRIAAHLRAKTGTVRASSGCPLLVVIDEAAPTGIDPSASGRTLVAKLNAGARRAQLFRISR